MNAEFERNAAYPYTVAPEGGYGEGATGKHIIVDVRTQKQVGQQTFSDPVAASMGISRIKQGW